MSANWNDEGIGWRWMVPIVTCHEQDDNPILYVLYVHGRLGFVLFVITVNCNMFVNG